MPKTFRGLPLIKCAHSETVWQAVLRAGYLPATHRAGYKPYSKPRAGEKIVAWARANRHSSPLPIFKKENDNE